MRGHGFYSDLGELTSELATYCHERRSGRFSKKIGSRLDRLSKAIVAFKNDQLPIEEIGNLLEKLLTDFGSIADQIESLIADEVERVETSRSRRATLLAYGISGGDGASMDDIDSGLLHDLSRFLEIAEQTHRLIDEKRDFFVYLLKDRFGSLQYAGISQQTSISRALHGLTKAKPDESRMRNSESADAFEEIVQDRLTKDTAQAVLDEVFLQHQTKLANWEHSYAKRALDIYVEYEFLLEQLSEARELDKSDVPRASRKLWTALSASKHCDAFELMDRLVGYLVKMEHTDQLPALLEMMLQRMPAWRSSQLRDELGGRIERCRELALQRDSIFSWPPQVDKWTSRPAEDASIYFGPTHPVAEDYKRVHNSFRRLRDVRDKLEFG